MKVWNPRTRHVVEVDGWVVSKGPEREIVWLDEMVPYHDEVAETDDTLAGFVRWK